MRKPLILLADDNQDVAHTSTLVLELFGYEVMAVNDGKAAVEAAKDRTPDFVILDVGLPELNGFQVAGKLRKELGLKETIIVAVSGYDRDTIRGQDEDRCFDYYFTKPVSFEYLDALFRPADELTLPNMGSGKPGVNGTEETRRAFEKPLH